MLIDVRGDPLTPCRADGPGGIIEPRRVVGFRGMTCRASRPGRARDTAWPSGWPWWRSPRTFPQRGHRPTLINDEPSQPEPPCRRQGRVSVGHEGLRWCEVGAWLLHTSPGGLRHSPADPPRLTSWSEHLICRWPLSSGHGKTASAPGVEAVFCCSSACLLIFGARVWRRAVRLICAGWLPQDGLFGWNASAGLEIERSPLGRVVHSCVAGRSSRCNQRR